MEIQLLRTSDDKRKLKKSYTLIYTVNGTMKEDCDILNPIITMDVDGLNDFSTVNYIYISRFKRFYFVRDIIIKRHKIVEYHLHVDVLMTYSSAIGGIQTLIDRQENKSNKYIIDDLLMVRTERKITYKEIGTLGNPSGSHIALTITGGE